MVPGTRSVTGDDILALISPHMPADDRPGLTSSSDLWSSGMDSLTSVSVMLVVEDEYDLEFPDEYLTREVFSDAEHIAAAVRAILAGQEG
ncbi:acyl carrier protein [Streptomyces sp. NPDC021224]|uniref:acyl carrier protein n=1 Tax=unclassified Streptomyces TaxID=2593676 RepID=UPI00378D2707